MSTVFKPDQWAIDYLYKFERSGVWEVKSD